MLKTYENLLCRLSPLIFNDCQANGIFLSDWKKGNIVPVHEKNGKQHLKKYQPISLLRICSKMFEQLIFNEMFENDLIY